MNLERPSMPSAPPVEDNDEIDLGALLAMVWAGKWKIAFSVFATLILGVLYYVSARPVYEANGLVQVEQNEKGGLSSAMGDLGSLFGAPMETQAEIEILKSRMVLGKVISALRLEISAEPLYFPLVGRFIARKSQPNDGLATAWLGLNTYAWGGERIEVTALTVPNTWLGFGIHLVAAQDGSFQLFDKDGNALGNGTVGQLLRVDTIDGPLEVFVQDIKARPGTEFVLQRNALADVLKEMSEALKVTEQGKQSGIISITFEGKSPQYVAGVIQQMQDAYVRQNVERRSAEAQQSLEFLQQQLPDIRARADAAQAKLNAYQLKQGSVNVTKETEIVLQQAVDLETKRLELSGQRQQAIQRFTPQHPAVQAIDAQIQSIDRELGGIKKRSEALPETQQEVLSLMRELEVNSQIYTTLLNSTQELQVAKAGTVGNVRIIDYPLLPSKKAKPKAALVLAASFILGIGGAMAWIFIQKALFQGVSRPDEVEKVVGLATYAAIPFVQTQKKLAVALRRREKGDHILAAKEPDNVAIEALRSFRTSLQFALLESSNNIVMFTGPAPGLGKSFISVNLGAVLALSGKKVAVVDVDLRRGHLHKYIGADATPGLSDYISGNADFLSVLRRTSVPGLTLVTNGTTPPNPAELLLHERFNQLLEMLSQSHDLVILDTPPVLPVTDASIVGRLAGAVFVVLKEGEHSMKMIEETVRRLRQSGVQVRGTIFNQIGARSGGYGYYYSAYGYSYASKYKSGQ